MSFFTANLKAYFSCLVLLCLLGSAKGQKYPFQYFSSDQGISSQYIYHFSEGRQGELLLSTEVGLISFNGFTFSTPTDAENEQEKIVNTHLQTSDDAYWLGYYQDGVARIAAGSLLLSKHPLLSTSRVMLLVELPDNNCLAVTQQNGFFTLSPTLEVLGHYSTPEALTVSSAHFTTGQLIIGTRQGIRVFDVAENGLGFEPVASDYSKLNQAHIVAIVDGKSANDIWFVTKRQGMHLMKASAGIYQHQLTIFDALKLEASDSYITSFTAGKVNEYWVGTNNSGLRKLTFLSDDQGAFQVQTIGEGNGLEANFIRALYCGTNGNLWIGTFGDGLIQLATEEFLEYSEFLPPKRRDVYTVTADREGELWAGTEQGVFRIIPGTTQTTHFNGANGFVDDQVKALYYDPSVGVMWLGTEKQGLYHYNFNQKKFKRVAPNQLPDNLKINAITDGGANQIFIASDEGFFIYDKKGDTYRHITTNEGLVHNVLRCIFKDSKGRVWFGADGATLFSYQDGTYTVHKEMPGLRSYKLNSITEDAAGNIWVASEGDGIYKYDGKSFVNYGVNEGLVSNYCYLLTFGQDSLLYVGHRNGLSVLNTSDQSVKRFNRERGMLQESINNNACFVDAAGRLWLGTSEGLLRYNAKSDNEALVAPNLSISSIKINDKIYTKDSITLPYGEYTLRIEYIGIDLATPSRINYRYRLNGIEDNWVITGKKREAYYPKLEDGIFSFEVEACNENGTCTTLKNAIHIQIAEPYWKKTWFRVGVPLAILLLIVVYFRWRVSRLKREQAVLEQLVSERTSELREEKENLNLAKIELEDKNKSITDSINYAQRIQKAMLPNEALLNQFDAEMFVVYFPRDIVSGDFYWVAKHQDFEIVVVADCTGHGVPGALLSMIGSTLLDKIVVNQNITDPAEIVRKLDAEIVESLKQEGHDGTTDGIDLGVLCVNRKQKELKYCGAPRPLILANEGAYQMIDGCMLGVGGRDERALKAYETTTYAYQNGEMAYFFSDGIVDQFGGPQDKKFMIKRLRTMLLEISARSLNEQQQAIANVFQDWKGYHPQTDDVLLIGVRLD